jgi:uncharacterized membrane protein
MLEYFINYPIGTIHLLSSVISLAAGTVVLILQKGTVLHRKIGYVYATGMLVVNGTALVIYRLFDGFGIFHYAALLSLLTLVGGMVPVLLRKPENSWLNIHFSFMYWSVMGLYAAFASEVLTRVPETPFFGMVGIATGIIMTAAGVYFYYGKHRWEELET